MDRPIRHGTVVAVSPDRSCQCYFSGNGSKPRADCAETLRPLFNRGKDHSRAKSSRAVLSNAKRHPSHRNLVMDNGLIRRAVCTMTLRVRSLLPTNRPHRAFIGLALPVSTTHRRACPSAQNFGLWSRRDELHGSVADNERRGRPSARERHSHRTAERNAVLSGKDFAIRHRDSYRASSHARSDK
jgi:hypothetical protein